MKDLNSFITEKFKISKGIKLVEPVEGEIAVPRYGDKKYEIKEFASIDDLDKCKYILEKYFYSDWMTFDEWFHQCLNDKITNLKRSCPNYVVGCVELPKKRKKRWFYWISNTEIEQAHSVKNYNLAIDYAAFYEYDKPQLNPNK